MAKQIELEGKIQAQATGTAELAVPSELAGGLVVQGEESGGGLNLGRLVLFQGSVEEEEKYGSVHKRGTFLDALECRNLGTSVTIMPVAAWMQWIKWPKGEKLPTYVHTRKADVPNGEAEWNGDEPPIAKEVVNVLVVVEGEEWPMLLQLKSTALKAWNKTIRPIEARRGAAGKTPGVYELGTSPDKNADGDPYHRLTARPAGDPSPEMVQQAVALRRLFDKYKAEADKVVESVVPEGGDDVPF